ncbi:MAG TPA: hypothetical protein VKE41_16710 [Roseiflexaceae bacterium]|nr:hypothetical protein [Roseiflexaceae bacterium]
MKSIVNSPAVPFDTTTIRLVLMRLLRLDERHGSCYDPRRYGDCTPDSLLVRRDDAPPSSIFLRQPTPAPTARRRIFVGRRHAAQASHVDLPGAGA